jgi:hypothetical protein
MALAVCEMCLGQVEVLEAQTEQSILQPRGLMLELMVAVGVAARLLMLEAMVLLGPSE